MKSIQKGEIIETLIANMVTIKSEGNLLVYRPIVDLGIDLIIDKKDRFNPVFIQIKSREATFPRSEKFSNFWNTSTIKIKPHDRFYLLFLRIDYDTGDVKSLWFMPSRDFNADNYKGKNANKYKSTIDNLIKNLNKLI